jgi:TldD protein
MVEDSRIYKKLLQRVLLEGGESADVFREKREDARISFSSENSTLLAYGFSEGIALRLFKNPFCGTIHIESPVEDDLWRAADALRDLSRVKAGILSIHEDSKKRSASHFPINNEMEDAYPQNAKERFKKSNSNKDFKDITSRIEEIGLHLKEYSRDKLLFSLNGSFYRQNIHVYDSGGIDVEDEREGAILRIKISNKENSFDFYSEENLEFSSADDFKEKLNPSETAKEVIEKSLAQKDTVKAPEGDMPLVLKNGSGGVFIHEVVGHLFEADNPLMDSIYNERERIPVRDSVSIFDDPSLMVRGSYQYDDEGVKGRKKPLILSGKWMSLLHDVRTAKRKRTRAEGNGRRQSFRDIPLPRTSAIFMEKGDLLPEDVVNSVKKGIFATGFGQSNFEESSGDFSIHVTSGNIIEDGKIGAPISGALILGNSLKVLRAIDLVARDLQFDKTGLSCSKFGQRIPSSVGTPTMRIGLIRVVPQ